MSCCHDPTLKMLFIMKRCGLALCLAILINGHGQTLAANYPISGAWTVAPTNSRQIVYVRHACQAFRRKEDLTLKAAAGRLVILRAGESTWYNNIGTRVCQNVSSKAVGKKSFHLVDVCRENSGHIERKSYTLKRLNSLQVIITPDSVGSGTYELIGCRLEAREAGHRKQHAGRCRLSQADIPAPDQLRRGHGDLSSTMQAHLQAM